MKEKTGDIQEHFIFKDISAYLHLALGEEEKRWYLQILNKPQRFLSTEVLYYPGDWNDRLSSKSLLA
jgi:DNA helicase-2/ATP-dependent DNA helicase PcrA